MRTYYFGTGQNSTSAQVTAPAVPASWTVGTSATRCQATMMKRSACGPSGRRSTPGGPPLASPRTVGPEHLIRPDAAFAVMLAANAARHEQLRQAAEAGGASDAVRRSVHDLHDAAMRIGADETAWRRAQLTIDGPASRRDRTRLERLVGRASHPRRRSRGRVCLRTTREQARPARGTDLQPERLPAATAPATRPNGLNDAKPPRLLSRVNGRLDRGAVTTAVDELRVPRERGAAARFVFGLRVPRPGYPRVY